MLNVILIKNYSEPPRCEYDTLKVIYHPLYSMNNFVANKSKLPQDGAQVFPYMGDWLSCEFEYEHIILSSKEMVFTLLELIPIMF